MERSWPFQLLFLLHYILCSWRPDQDKNFRDLYIDWWIWNVQMIYIATTHIVFQEKAGEPFSCEQWTVILHIKVYRFVKKVSRKISSFYYFLTAESSNQYPIIINHIGVLLFLTGFFCCTVLQKCPPSWNRRITFLVSINLNNICWLLLSYVDSWI